MPNQKKMQLAFTPQEKQTVYCFLFSHQQFMSYLLCQTCASESRFARKTNRVLFSFFTPTVYVIPEKAGLPQIKQQYEVRYTRIALRKAGLPQTKQQYEVRHTRFALRQLSGRPGNWGQGSCV